LLATGEIRDLAVRTDVDAFQNPRNRVPIDALLIDPSP